MSSDDGSGRSRWPVHHRTKSSACAQMPSTAPSGTRNHRRCTSRYRQNGPGPMTFEVRTAGDPIAFVTTAREIIRGVDRNVPMFRVQSQEQQIEASVSRERLFARLAAYTRCCCADFVRDRPVRTAGVHASRCEQVKSASAWRWAQTARCSLDDRASVALVADVRSRLRHCRKHGRDGPAQDASVQCRPA